MLFNSQPIPFQGASLSHHRLARFHSSPDMASLQIWLDCWPSEQARLEPSAPITQWHLLAPLAGLDLQHGILAAISAFVCAAPEFPACSEISDASGTLQAARDRKWAAVKAEREARLLGTFTWQGHEVDVDIEKLTGAAVDAREALIAGASYSDVISTWTLADDSVLMLTAEQQISLGRACAAYVRSLWATAQQLRADIDAADTLDTVNAIHWPT